jgi:mono/diheme cytochrome c family protein
MMGQSMARHRLAMMGSIPAAYRGLSNPLPATPEVLAQGERLYSANCATCHGESGAGDGQAGAGLSPPPADLRWLMRMPMASDGYLMWTMSEGGADLGTAMPAFKTTLGEGERWKVVRYLRTFR